MFRVSLLVSLKRVVYLEPVGADVAANTTHAPCATGRLAFADLSDRVAFAAEIILGRIEA